MSQAKSSRPPMIFRSSGVNFGELGAEALQIGIGVAALLNDGHSHQKLRAEGRSILVVA